MPERTSLSSLIQERASEMWPVLKNFDFGYSSRICSRSALDKPENPVLSGVESWKPCE